MGLSTYDCDPGLVYGPKKMTKVLIHYPNMEVSAPAVICFNDDNG